MAFMMLSIAQSFSIDTITSVITSLFGFLYKYDLGQGRLDCFLLLRH